MTDDRGADGSDGRPSLADRRDIERVYQPAEDSKLLADATVEDVAPSDRALDVPRPGTHVERSVAGLDVPDGRVCQ